MKSALPSVSVVITSLNAAPWIAETVQLAGESLKAAGLTEAEFIIIDDGSTDGTGDVAASLTGPYAIHVIRQEHKGRYLGRQAGVLKAKYDHIFFIDSRVHIHTSAMSFLREQLKDHPGRQVWNGHIIVAKRGNPIARFGDTVTFLGWRRYFAHPTTTSYGLKDFDYYPKGTGCFFLPKAMFTAAMAEFESTTSAADLEFASDDTLLIRILARDHRINLSPHFAATYYARTSLPQFIKHTYRRGQNFIDGFLRPGTRFYRPLILALAGSAALLVAIIIHPPLILPLLVLAAVCWLLILAATLALRVPPADALSFFTLLPVFVITYGAGLWRGLLRQAQSGRSHRS